MFSGYFKRPGNGDLSQYQTMLAYLGGSTFQTIGDNPVTAYRQLVQQYAKGLNGKAVDPAVARAEANAVFRGRPMAAGLSGLGPRLVGVGFKRVPKFGFLLGIAFALDDNGTPGLAAATGASIASAPFINPIRMIEKQQRAYFKQTNAVKPVVEILKESAAQGYRPLFRGTVPLMGHSLASATLGLVGQPQLQKRIQREMNSKTQLGQTASGMLASSLVSPIYVGLTNPLSRLEVIMQTASIGGQRIGLGAALAELASDRRQFGLRGAFRGQGVGLMKAIISLTMFHEGRMFLTERFRRLNRNVEAAA